MSQRHAATFLAAEEIERLRDELSMLDVFRARQETTSERGLVAYHKCAVRLGIVPEDTELEAFLSRLRTEDFNRIMGESLRVMTGQTAPKAEEPESSGSSESGGGIVPPFSSGTGSDPETS